MADRERNAKRSRYVSDEDGEEQNAMSVDPQNRRIVRANRKKHITYTQFMTDCEAFRQQLVERENSQWTKLLPSLKSDDEEMTAEKSNVVMQLTADHRRVFHVIDQLYPPRESDLKLVSMGDDSVLCLGIQESIEANSRSNVPPTLVRNAPQSALVSIAAGGTHSVALHEDGSVHTWGNTDDGQLGRYDIQDNISHLAGKVVVSKGNKEGENGEALGRITEVHAGDSHTLMRDLEGFVWMAGMYKDTDSGKWRPVPEGSSLPIKGSHKHAIRIELPKPAKFIATGFNHSAAVLPDGDGIFGADVLYTWGMGHNGANGRSQAMGCPPITGKVLDPDTMKESTFDSYDTGKDFMGWKEIKKLENEDRTPKVDKNGKQETEEFYHYYDDKVKLFLKPGPVQWAGPKLQRQVLSVALGKIHMLVVAREAAGRSSFAYDPRVYSCGNSGHGQLGHGNLFEKHQLTPIEALDGKMISQVAAGEYHSLALDMFGQNVYAWGNAGVAALGLFDKVDTRYVKTPEAVPFPEGLGSSLIVDIDAGDSTSFATTNDGDVYSWGFGEMGANGHSGVLDTYRPKLLNIMRKITKTRNTGTTCKVVRVAGGGQHALMLIKRFA